MRSSFLMLSWLRRSAPPVFFILLLVLTLLTLPGRMFGWEALAADCGGAVYERVVKYWDKRFGGASEDYLTALVSAPDGGYVLGGYTYSGAEGDKSEASQGAYDYWVVKINGNGDKEWDKRFGGSDYDYLKAIVATSDGGYVLGGYSWSGPSGDKSQGSRGSADYWVVKIDGSGVKVWDKRFGGSSVDYLNALVATSDGGYALGGYTYSGAEGDKSEASQGAYDYWVVKINGNGDKEWDKRFGGSAYDYLNALVATPDGGYVLGGYSESEVSGDKSESSRGFYDYWVVKIDGNGTQEWDKVFGGTAFDELRALELTDDGGYLLGGYSESGVSGDKSESSRGFYDFWVLKIDGNGDKQWDKSFGGDEYDWSSDLLATDDGGFIVGGNSYSGVSGDKSEAPWGVYPDYWLVKLDGSGNKLWDKRFGGTVSEELGAVALTKDGGYVLAGYSESGADGDKSEASRGYIDYWVVHMDIDRDCDGIMDGAEARADTDPTNAVSYLAVTALNRGPGQVQLGWQGGAAVTQVIERTATLLNPAWVPVYTNPPPTAITNLLSINETNPAAAYRVRVPR